jgi:cytoskeleton protein RodZ
MTAQKELIPMRPGELLRHEREKQGLTLERAAELSRIKPAVLSAIESGATSDIPSVYLKGYIRNYARFLRVEAPRIEETLEFATGSEPPVQSVFNVPNRRGRAEKWLKASSYLAASAVIAALAWQFTHEAVRFSQGDARLGADATAPAETVEGRGEKPGAAGESRAGNTHLNASIAAMEMLERRGELDGKAAAEQAWAAIGGRADEPLPESHSATAAVDGTHRLAMTTSADTWVEILDGQGTQLELDLIRAGSEREYQGVEPFHIMLGRASAVVMTLDGEAIDLGPHTRGNVARLVLGDAAAASANAEPPQSQSNDR